MYRCLHYQAPVRIIFSSFFVLVASLLTEWAPRPNWTGLLWIWRTGRSTQAETSASSVTTSVASDIIVESVAVGGITAGLSPSFVLVSLFRINTQSFTAHLPVRKHFTVAHVTVVGPKCHPHLATVDCQYILYII